MKSKGIVFLLLLCNMLSILMPVRVLAESFEGNMKTTSKTIVNGESMKVTDANESKEKVFTSVLTKVKKKINIPKEYINFSYYYRAASSYQNETWNLDWRKEDDGSSIRVMSDSSGNIMSYNFYNMVDEKEPKYLKNELKSKADAFILQVASNIYSKLKFNNSYYGRGRSGTYYYNYIRVEQGIPMSGQNVVVGIDISTGEVISYDNSNWNYEVSIPKKEVILSKNQAIAKLESNITMNLVYHNRYLTDSQGNTKIKAVLVYEPSISYIAIDAKTGEIYTTRSEWRNESSNDGSTADKNTSTGDGGLTKVEINKISELKNLISKEKAVELITKNKNLYLDSSKTAVTANLSESINYFNKESKRYLWNIQFTEPSTESNEYDFYSSYASATVDANTGEIVSFFTKVNEYTQSQETMAVSNTVKYQEKQCRDILEEFIKAQNKGRILKSKLTKTEILYKLPENNLKKINGGYSFTYERVNEGIVYSENNIYGSVDGVTGKITSYGYNWEESVEFESPKGIITPKQAYSNYMGLDGFQLIYELNTISTPKKMTQEARLVYNTEISPCYISPFTGKQVHYDATEYVKNGSNYLYEDIKDHKYYRSIQILVDMGMVIEGKKFNPDQAITKYELQQMVEPFIYISNENKLSGAGNITRQEAALFSIKLLDLNSLASINGIYKTGFLDEAEIAGSYLGAVALAKGLDILRGDASNRFYPASYLTRAEAADMFIKILASNR